MKKVKCERSCLLNFANKKQGQAKQYVKTGFTLIEVVIVIGLLTLISVLTVIVSLKDYQSFLFRGDRDLAVDVLYKARSQAINNICLGSTCTEGKPHGVHFESGKYVIFQGSSYATRDASVDEIITVNDPVQTSGLPEVVFFQLSGQASPSGTITISDSAGHNSNININAEGRIDW